MANAVRVRVEVRGNSQHEVDSSFKWLHRTFKKACGEAGVAHAYRQHEAYESRSRKRRRKKKESAVALLKTKLKENFLAGRKNNDY